MLKARQLLKKEKVEASAVVQKQILERFKRSPILPVEGKELNEATQPNPTNKPELIELFLTDKMGTADENFRQKFKTLLERTPRIHSNTANHPEFWPSFFLGSTLILPYTELMAKLGIKDIYVKITSEQTIKLVFNIEKGGEKQLVFKTIAATKEVTYRQHLKRNEIEEVARELGLTKADIDNYEIKGEIVYIKDGSLDIQDLKVAKGNNLKNLKELDKAFKESIQNEPQPKRVKIESQFKRVEGIYKEKEVGNIKTYTKVERDNFETDFIKLSSKDPNNVKERAEKIFRGLAQVYRSTALNKRDTVHYLPLSDTEAAYHGYSYGALAMNFKYRYALDINIERIAGKGYSDMMFLSRLDGDKNKNWDALPVVVEFKRSTEPKHTAQDAVKQIENMGYLKNLPSMRTVAETGVIVGVNFDHDPKDETGVMVETLDKINEHRSFAKIFEEHSDDITRATQGDQTAIGRLKEVLKTKLNYLYYSFTNANGGGENTNYSSRLILGELLADNSLEKHAFVYDNSEVYDSKGIYTDPIQLNRIISTFLFRTQDNKHIVLNVIEGEGFKVDKGIPFNGLSIDSDEYTQVNVKVNPEASDGFEVEGKNDKSYYQSVEIGKVTNSQDRYKGKFEKIRHLDVLNEKNQVQVEDLQKVLSPLRELIIAENDFQAVLQGLFTAQEANEDIRVFMEPNHSSMGRADLVVSRVRKDSNGKYQKDKLVVLELKYAKSPTEAKRKSSEGKDQIKKYRINLKTFTDEGEIKGQVLVFTSDGKSMSIESEIVDLIIDHSSHDLSYDPLRSPGLTKDMNFKGVVASTPKRGAEQGGSSTKRSKSSPEKQELPELEIRAGCSHWRKKRSTGMSCIDSRDEEEITKEEKEKHIKELFNTDKGKNIIKYSEFYEQFYKVSEQISRGEIIDQNVKEAFIAKIKNVDLNSIDPEIRDVVEEMKNNIENKEEIKNILRRSGVAEKIGKVAEGVGLTYRRFLNDEKSEYRSFISRITNNKEAMNRLGRVGKVSGWAMHGMMYRNLIGDIISGNAEGVAINLGFIGGGPVLSKLAKVTYAKGELFALEGKRLGKLLKAGSPFLGRVTSGYMIYDLANQVKAYRAGNKDALAGIIGDSVAIITDVAEVGIEVAEVFGILEGVSSITGPIGATIGVMVFIGADIYTAVRTVKKEDEIVHLTGWEKFKEGWRAFLHIPPEKYIEELIEVKEANDQLIRDAIKFLKDHNGIQGYVFPTGRLVKSCHTVPYKTRVCTSGGLDGGCFNSRLVTRLAESCTNKLQTDLNNAVLLDRKETDIKWSRTRPNNPKEGDFFCLPKGDYEPAPKGGAYVCENAIGLSYQVNRTGNGTYFALGKGKDEARGFKDSSNIFLVEGGYKSLIGGDKDDLFILRGSEIRGILDGGGGINTIDLTNFAPDVIGLTIGLGIRGRIWEKETLLSTRNHVLGVDNISMVKARKGKRDVILCPSGRTQYYVDGQGGKNKDNPDVIKVRNGYVRIAVRPYTEVYNDASIGNFTYLVFPRMGNAQVKLLPGYGHHYKVYNNFIFNYTIADLKSINIQGIGNISYIYNGYNTHTVKSITFSSLLSVPDEVFNLTISNNYGANVNYIFNDNTQIKIGEKGNLYVLQATDKPINDIIRDYPAIADRLNMTIVVESQDEFVTIGHGKHEVLYNEPSRCSHLIGNGGENVYVIDSNYDSVNIYDANEASSINTLDLRGAVKSLRDWKDAEYIGPKISGYPGDLSICLQYRIKHSLKKLVEFQPSINLVNGTGWYKKLHIILDSAPMQIKYSESEDDWNLEPMPLIFNENTKIAVITVKDIEEGNKIIVRKQVVQYVSSRLRDSLIIITDSSLEGSNTCTMLFSNFYKEPKMETLSIEFNNVTISLQKEMGKVNDSKLIFCPSSLRMNETLSINGNDLLNNYDCLKFDSNKIAFLKSGNNLLLSSNQGILLIRDYYSDAHERWNLLIELNDNTIKPEEFKERASSPSLLRYYQPNEQGGLQIYHNQPENKHQVGVVDLKDKSILDCNMQLNQTTGGLMLSSDDNATVIIKNWVTEEAARKVIFTFNNTIVSNSQCVVSTCNPEDVIVEFNKEKEQLILNKELLIAIRKSGDLNEIESLISQGANIRGADVDIASSRKFTPLHRAAEKGLLFLVEYFVEKGANINAKIYTGRTPLHLAARYGYLKVVQYLVEKGADPYARDNGGQKPLDVASFGGHSDVVKYLKRIEKEKRKPTQRKRRHNHGDHYRHHNHLSRKPLAINLSYHSKVTASSGKRASSWINDLSSWVKDSVCRLFSSRAALSGKRENSTMQSLPSIPQHNETAKDISLSGFLSVENVALIGCIVDTLNNTPSRRYQNLISKGVEVVPSSKIAVEVALRKFDSFVNGRIRNLNSKEKTRIRSELKEAYPEIIESFRRGVEFSGNVGLDNVLKKCKKYFCTNILTSNIGQPESQMPWEIDDKPKTHLSDITINNQLKRSQIF